LSAAAGQATHGGPENAPLHAMQLSAQPGRATPSDVVAALRGSSVLTLRGFAAQVRAPSFLRPGVQFVSPAITAEELRGVLVVRSKRIRLVLWAALVCSHLAVAAAAGWLWKERTDDAQVLAGTRSDAAVTWSVVQVLPDAVVVQVQPSAASAAQAQSAQPLRLKVTLGGKLPNGDVLSLVDATRSMYATPSARVFLVGPRVESNAP